MIFFAEIIVGILSFVFKNWFHQQFAKFVNETIEKYRDDPDLQNVIDFSQEYVSGSKRACLNRREAMLRSHRLKLFTEQWMCCGGDTASDWENNIYFNCSSSIEYTGKQLTPAEACGVPYSCCIKSVAGGVADMQCGYNVRKLDVSCFFSRFLARCCSNMEPKKTWERFAEDIWLWKLEIERYIRMPI